MPIASPQASGCYFLALSSAWKGPVLPYGFLTRLGSVLEITRARSSDLAASGQMGASQSLYTSSVLLGDPEALALEIP